MSPPYRPPMNIHRLALQTFECQLAWFAPDLALQTFDCQLAWFAPDTLLQVSSWCRLWLLVSAVCCAFCSGLRLMHAYKRLNVRLLYGLYMYTVYQVYTH